MHSKLSASAVSAWLAFTFLFGTSAYAAPVANLPLTCSTASAITHPQNDCNGVWAYQLPTTDQLIVLTISIFGSTWERAASLSNDAPVAVCALPVEPGFYSSCRDASGVRRIVNLRRGDVFGATNVYVTANGVDSETCGGLTETCRSISQAIKNARIDATILVGSGRYGDLDADGFPDPGDEAFGTECNCMLHVTKRVSIISVNGAAATLVRGESTRLIRTVLIAADGVTFGARKQGFTLTESIISGLEVGDVSGVRVEGNLARGHTRGFRINGRDNEIVGNVAIASTHSGFELDGVHQTAWRNAAIDNGIGFNLLGDRQVLTENTASGNGGAVHAAAGSSEIVGNDLVGNDGSGVMVFSAATTVNIRRNNIYGNNTPRPDSVNPTNCGVYNLIREVNAVDNFWGAPTGPGPDPADAVCNNSSQSITHFVPFATEAFVITAPGDI